MASHIIKLLHQGVWPTLTGGWYYDPLHSEFTNVFHFYVWLLLMCLPLSLYKIFTPSWEVIGSYVAGIMTLFFLLKLVNWRLHEMFDHGEVIKTTKDEEEETSSKTEEDERVEEAKDDQEKNENDPSETGETNEVKTSMAVTNEQAATDIAQLFRVDVHQHDGHGNKDTPAKTQLEVKEKLKVTKKQKPVKGKKKIINIDHCHSVSSASSVSATPTSSTSSGWVIWNENKDVKAADLVTSTDEEEAVFTKREHRIQRKPGIRGHKHHPWRNRNREAEKPTVDFAMQTMNQNHTPSSSEDETTKSSSTTTKFHSQSSISRRKRVSGDRPTLSPARKKLASDVKEENEIGNQTKDKEESPTSPTQPQSLDASPSRNSIENAASDQELLSNDPVWKAKMSRRYNSDNRLFLNRRTYTVNHQRMNSDRTHDHTSEIPFQISAEEPNQAETSSTIRKILNKVNKMWEFTGTPLPQINAPTTSHRPPTPIPSPVLGTRDVTQETALLDLDKSMDSGAIGDSSNIKKVPRDFHATGDSRSGGDFHIVEVSPDKYGSGSTSKIEKNLSVSEEIVLNVTPQHLSDLTSYNSNPHCNQLSPHSRRGGATTSRLAHSTSMRHQLTKRRARTNKRTQSTPLNAEMFAHRSFPDRPQTRRGMLKSDRLRLESDDSSDNESDYLNRLTSVLNAHRDNTNPVDLPGPSHASVGTNTYTRHHQRNKAHRDNNNWELVGPSTSRSDFTTREKRVFHPASTLPTSTDKPSSSSRRMRHPAGQRTISESASEETAVFSPLSTADAASASDKVHMATDHDDTTSGAVHTFQDEQGNWFRYTFTDNSPGIAIPFDNNSPAVSPTIRDSEVSDPGWVATDTTWGGADTGWTVPEDGAMYSGNTQQPPVPKRPATPKVKLYYKYRLFPFKSIVLQYDRLKLLDLLDRNRYLVENVAAIFLAVCVAFLGFLLLWRGYFKDVWPVWFCAVIATAQYSMVRSVQPDTASPSHGHNRVIAYSRPIYFITLCLLVLLFDHLAGKSLTGFQLYGHYFFTSASCMLARNILLVMLMTLPFIFLFGLLPQINTFVIYLTEQVDVHMFGGTACSGVISGLFCIARSLITCLVLYGFCYGGLKTVKGSQHILFSAFCGLLVSLSYHLSRQPANPQYYWNIIKVKLHSHMASSATDSQQSILNEGKEENPDNISGNYVQAQMIARLKLDMIICPVLAVFMFAIHCSTAFQELQPILSTTLYVIAGSLGFILHYVIPQLRKQFPWLILANPVLQSHEYSFYEVTEQAKLMWYESVHVWLCFFERSVLYPIIIMNQLTIDAEVITRMYGIGFGCFIICFIGLKLLRSAYSTVHMHYIVLTFTVLFAKFDGRNYEDAMLVTYFFFTILFVKIQEFMLKLQFVYVYVAPWQITWGSAFHAFAQPFSVPHSGMLLVQSVISSLLHAPLTPFLGSAVFLTSYVRPLKFWERDYKTKRVDHSNSRLATQLDNKNMGSDDNNLNSIFYEHLTLSLQKSLCGDLQLGRWGNVYPGDCFIMASEYLNALVHIIEIGNGSLTFQLRGLEFSGTYCQQREVEAITECTSNTSGCCCFKNVQVKNFLSFNTAFHQRWLAWQIESTKYLVDGYSITDNSASAMLGVFDLRKVLIGYLVKGVIYFLISHDSLEAWIDDEAIHSGTCVCEVPGYVDTDPSFAVTIDDDYDVNGFGVSRKRFCEIYEEWIQFCISKRKNEIAADKMNRLISLCFSISVMARRALGTASQHSAANHVVVESFLYGLYALFKGDFRITSSKDEWVFTDMDILHQVVVPGVRMSLKLHQDHFTYDEYEQASSLYDVIDEYKRDMIITHEADPEWRKAVLSNKDSLLALRNVTGGVLDSYYVIMLKRRSLEFRVVRVNRECMRGLWAGQQQELIFLRNRNPERGSIQNAKQVLRNMINSSCDQPIGYPIYVSPLTTSFANSHPQVSSIASGRTTYDSIRAFFNDAWHCLKQSCTGSCNSGGSAGMGGGISMPRPQAPTPGAAARSQSVHSSLTADGSQHSSTTGIPAMPSINERGGNTPTPNTMATTKHHRSSSLQTVTHELASDRASLSRQASDKPMSSQVEMSALTHRVHTSSASLPTIEQKRQGSVSSSTSSINKTSSLPHTTVGRSIKEESMVGTPGDSSVKTHGREIAKITNVSLIFRTLNKPRDNPFVMWPDELMRKNAGQNAWRQSAWQPQNGTIGEIVHRWYPSHRERALRSHIDDKIVVLKVSPHNVNHTFYVPIQESGIVSIINPSTETTKV